MADVTPGADRRSDDVPPDAPDVRPLLGEGQLAVLRNYGTEAPIEQGQILFTDGDDRYDLIVVLGGRVDIIEHLAHPNETLITQYGAREFLGEIGLLTGQRAFLSARVEASGSI